MGLFKDSLLQNEAAATKDHHTNVIFTTLLQLSDSIEAIQQSVYSLKDTNCILFLLKWCKVF